MSSTTLTEKNATEVELLNQDVTNKLVKEEPVDLVLPNLTIDNYNT